MASMGTLGMGQRKGWLLMELCSCHLQIKRLLVGLMSLTMLIVLYMWMNSLPMKLMSLN
jgi:hypothetical protein